MTDNSTVDIGTFVSGIYDAVIHLPEFISNACWYFISCILQAFYDLIDVLYSPIAYMWNLFTEVLQFLAEFITELYSWLPPDTAIPWAISIFFTVFLIRLVIGLYRFILSLIPVVGH